MKTIVTSFSCLLLARPEFRLPIKKPIKLCA